MKHSFRPLPKWTFKNLKQVLSPALPNIPIDDELLNQGKKELYELIGMNDIKQDIEEVIQIVRFKRQHGENMLFKFFFHTLLIGNPGTGKLLSPVYWQKYSRRSASSNEDILSKRIVKDW
jgi:hypothetical protein